MFSGVRALMRRTAALLLAALLPLALPGAARAEYAMPYSIELDISNQVVTIYDTATGLIARQMICSTGMRDYTPTGEFVLPEPERSDERTAWYRIDNLYVRYPTRIRKEILFHSIPYTRKSGDAINVKDASRLGFPVSHGCVRLRLQDAKFIAENCMPGTRVKIYKSGRRDDSLRELLLQESYDAASGLSYEAFYGLSSEEGALNRLSKGQEVLNLQYRLRDLGLYAGKLSGEYDSKTVNAVRAAQYLMHMDISGAASREFQQRIYAADAPTAMNVRLAEGMSGPAVRKLQDNLAVLRLFGDEPDSVYDIAVSQAVEKFQRAYLYNADGEASPQVQKAIAYEAGRVSETFEGAEYTCEEAEEPLALARVAVQRGAKLRKGPSQDTRQLSRLAMDDVVIVVDKGESWSKVRSGEGEGYIKNDLLHFFRQDTPILRYTCGGDGRVYIVGNSAEDYRAGARLPCEVFAEYLAATEQHMDIGSLVNYVTVDTGDGNAPLNLRQSPGTDGAVLCTVPNGAKLKVEQRYADWTLVCYQGLEGYLMNVYLKFWTGSRDALDAEQDDDRLEASMIRDAVVETLSGDPAPVFDDDSDDAALIGHLDSGVHPEVLEVLDGWMLIRCQGHQGYMMSEDLRLVLAED